MSDPEVLIRQLRTAAADALDFVEDTERADFLADRKCQSAVAMSLMVIGEIATRLIEKHPELVDAHPEIAWRSMRGMRNRIACGYFDIDFEIVWDTVQKELPLLVQRLSGI